jgi:hypothetical protein
MQKRKLTRIVCAAACSLLATNAMAIAPGLYLGMMMGPATNGGKPEEAQVNPLPTATNPQANVALANPKSTQFGSALYLGYKFNRYAGFEFGFTYFSGIQYVLQNKMLQASAGTTGRVRTAYLAGKFDYTYSNTIGFFGKVGVAATYVTVPGGLQPTNFHYVKGSVTQYPPSGQKPVNSGSNTYRSKLSPMFAVGASYDFNQSWQMDLSATRFLIGSQVGSMSLYALGFSYHFVDVYCGQFLCEN